MGNAEDLCVHWALEAGDAVPLDGILETEELWSFTFEEWLDEIDRNGDGDTNDTVVTLRGRSNGLVQPMDLHPACLPGEPGDGRATLRLMRGEFDFPAVVAEGSQVAFLEPESDFGAGCDMDLIPDGDTAGIALSVASVGDPEIHVSRWAAVDLATEIDGNALALSLIEGTGRSIAFARFDEAEASTDLYPDASLDDVVLGLLDEFGSTEIFCPAGQVATANGAAAFLRPEDPGVDGSADCPVGPLNGDGDTEDAVVHLLRRELGNPNWGVRSLGLAATEVDLSSSWIAALADEAGQPGVGNADLDDLDQVVHIRSLAEPLAGQPWINLGFAADRLLLEGDILVFRVPELAQGENLDGIEQDDNLLYVAVAGGLPGPLEPPEPGYVATGGRPPQLLGPAIDFVMGEDEVLCPGTDDRVRLLAYPTPSQGEDPGFVALRVFNAAHTAGEFSSTVSIAPGESVYPCDSDACHPEKPFHVQGHEVRFLTDEAEQQEDLDGDGSMDDLVLQINDYCAERSRAVGAVDVEALAARNPLAAPSALLPGEVLVQRAGRCVQPSPICSVGDADCCPRGSSPTRVGQEMACVYGSPASCSADSDCGQVADATVSCVSRPITVSVLAQDTDDDGIIDEADACDDDGLAGACIDGVQCRRAAEKVRVGPGEIEVSDALGSHLIRIQSVEGLCRTAGLSGATVNDGTAMATRWRVREPGFVPGGSLRLKDRFGAHEVILRKPLRLLRSAQEVPELTKLESDGAKPDLAEQKKVGQRTLSSHDHLCYQVREIRPEQRVRVLTLAGVEEQQAAYQVRRLRQLCLPTNLAAEQDAPMVSAWACYRAKLPAPASAASWTSRQIDVQDGFGLHDLRLGSDRDICVRAQVSEASLQQAAALLARDAADPGTALGDSNR